MMAQNGHRVQLSHPPNQDGALYPVSLGCSVVALLNNHTAEVTASNYQARNYSMMAISCIQNTFLREYRQWIRSLTPCDCLRRETS